jgi:hypothetical protein
MQRNILIVIYWLIALFLLVLLFTVLRETDFGGGALGKSMIAAISFTLVGWMHKVFFSSSPNSNQGRVIEKEIGSRGVSSSNLTKPSLKNNVNASSGSNTISAGRKTVQHSNQQPPQPSSSETPLAAWRTPTALPKYQEKSMKSSEENDSTTDKRWDVFVNYSSIADEIISSLWERGVKNFLAYEYLFELKKFVLSKDKITETKDEIVEAVIKSTEKQHKVTETEEVQLLYQKVRFVDPARADELKGVIEFLGDGADVKKLNEKFKVAETKSPLLTEFDVMNLKQTVAAEEAADPDNSSIWYKGYEIRSGMRSIHSIFTYCEVFEKQKKVSGDTMLYSVKDAEAFIDNLLSEKSANF